MDLTSYNRLPALEKEILYVLFGKEPGWNLYEGMLAVNNHDVREGLYSLLFIFSTLKGREKNMLNVWWELNDIKGGGFVKIAPNALEEISFLKDTCAAGTVESIIRRSESVKIENLPHDQRLRIVTKYQEWFDLLDVIIDAGYETYRGTSLVNIKREINMKIFSLAKSIVVSYPAQAEEGYLGCINNALGLLQQSADPNLIGNDIDIFFSGLIAKYCGSQKRNDSFIAELIMDKEKIVRRVRQGQIPRPYNEVRYS